MKLWMHGCGPNPQEGARHLKDLGFSVVVGGQDAAEAVLAQGMEYYICTGAYRGPQFQETSGWLKTCGDVSRPGFLLPVQPERK